MSYRHPSIEPVVTIKGAHVTENGQIKLNTTDTKTSEITQEALIEMQIMNLHLAMITDNELKVQDLDEA